MPILGTRASPAADVRAAGTLESGSSSLSIKLSPGAKPLANHRRQEEDGGWGCRPLPPGDRPPPAPASLWRHPPPRGAGVPMARPRPAPPAPLTSPPLAPGASSPAEPRRGRRGVPRRGDERGWVPSGRGRDAGARREPQHRPDTAAAAGGYRASPRAGSGGDPALPALRSARRARAPLPGDRHCQAQPRPLRAREPGTPGTRRRQDWLPELLAPPPAPPSRAGDARDGGRVGSLAGRGILQGRARSWVLQLLSFARPEINRRPREKQSMEASLGSFSPWEGRGCSWVLRNLNYLKISIKEARQRLPRVNCCNYSQRGFLCVFAGLFCSLKVPSFPV